MRSTRRVLALPAEGPTHPAKAAPAPARAPLSKSRRLIRVADFFELRIPVKTLQLWLRGEQGKIEEVPYSPRERRYVFFPSCCSPKISHSISASEQPIARKQRGSN